MSYRDVYLYSTSIIWENILAIELVLKSQTQLQQKIYYKSTTSDEDILSIRKETRPRLLSLLIIGDSQEHISSAK